MDIVIQVHFHTLQKQINQLRVDIVFIDPPFASNELEVILKQLASADLLNPGALIYIESAEALPECNLPNQWAMHRQKKAASVHYCLCRVIF